jgi:uncharacterized protein YbjT (DUF2867 family)
VTKREALDPSAKDLKVVLFGATGMVGAGVLQACLDDPAVSQVLAISRVPTGRRHPKLEELLHQDFFDYGFLRSRLAGYNACLFTLGVSSAGMKEADYSRVTYDLTLAAAKALLEANPGMSFCYVSGAGTDSTEQGRSMWARVKGRTENALLGLGFQPAVMLRPGGIQAMKGVKSKTPLYRFFYAFMDPFFPFLVRHFPSGVTTSQRLGRAMLKAARGEAGSKILESIDINRLGA